MRVLLTGATGFVGQHLYPALVSAGHEVLCGSRDPAKARAALPHRTWVPLDVEKPATIDAALEDCDAAYYLIHGMGQGSEDYPEREARSADNFIRAAEARNVGRVVYLGGVLPTGDRASKHLKSRQITGERLRSGEVSTVELRAAMIIGEGSAGWTMVKDLSARLPAMILPRWLRNVSHPVAVDDVVWALVAALDHPGTDSQVLEVPGPERISHRDLLQKVGRAMGRTRPMINVPVLSPRLSSYWIALVTRVGLDLAKELVEGVRYDLEPQEPVIWDSVDHRPMALEEAAQLALRDEQAATTPSHAASARMKSIGSELAAGSPWCA